MALFLSLLANCSLCGAEATLSFLAGPVCSSFSTEASTILLALCRSRQHRQVCHRFFSDFPSVLSISAFTTHSSRNCLLSYLLLNLRTLNSLGQRPGPMGGSLSSAVTCSLLSCLTYAFFSRAGCVNVSYKFFDTTRCVY